MTTEEEQKTKPIAIVERRHYAPQTGLLANIQSNAIAYMLIALCCLCFYLFKQIEHKNEQLLSITGQWNQVVTVLSQVKSSIAEDRHGKKSWKTTPCYSCHQPGSASGAPEVGMLKEVLRYNKNGHTGKDLIFYKVRNQEYPEWFLKDFPDKDVSGLMPAFSESDLSNDELEEIVNLIKNH